MVGEPLASCDGVGGAGHAVAADALDAALGVLLASGGQFLELGQVDDSACDGWVAAVLNLLPVAKPCYCHFLVGTKRDLGHRGSVLLVAPVGEAAKLDIGMASRGLGLTKGLRPGPSELCRNILGAEPEFLTPLAACAPGACARVAVSLALEPRLAAEAPVCVALRLALGRALACPLEAVLEVLRSRGVRVDCGIPCTSGAGNEAVLVAAEGWSDAGAIAALHGYAGEVHWVADAAEADSLAPLDDFRHLKGGMRDVMDAAIVAEGPETIRMLLGSDFQVERLLLKPSLFEGLREHLEARAVRRGERPVSVILCEVGLMERVTGVPAIHASAALASARRPAIGASAAGVVAALGLEASDSALPLRALALDEGLDEEEVGSLFRVAAAFGTQVVLLAAGCADRFSRRAVRVSMGHVFRVPAVCGDLAGMLHELHEQHGVLTIAATAQEDRGEGGSALCVDELGLMPRRWVCTVGRHGPVASAEVRAACEMPLAVRTAVPACPIGVGITAAVLLHGCCEREGREEGGGGAGAGDFGAP